MWVGLGIRAGLKNTHIAINTLCAIKVLDPRCNPGVDGSMLGLGLRVSMELIIRVRGEGTRDVSIAMARQLFLLPFSTLPLPKEVHFLPWAVHNVITTNDSLKGRL